MDEPKNLQNWIPPRAGNNENQDREKLYTRGYKFIRSLIASNRFKVLMLLGFVASAGAGAGAAMLIMHDRYKGDAFDNLLGTRDRNFDSSFARFQERLERASRVESEERKVFYNKIEGDVSKRQQTIDSIFQYLQKRDQEVTMKEEAQTEYQTILTDALNFLLKNKSLIMIGDAIYNDVISVDESGITLRRFVDGELVKVRAPY